MKKTPLRKNQKPLKKTPLKSRKKIISKKPLKNRGYKLKQNKQEKSVANQKRKRNIKKRSLRQNSTTPLSKEIVACDAAFSKYIRLLNADKDGMVKCFTCDNKAFWRQSGIQNGHYKSRSHMNTRWLKLNCEPQDVACNSFLGGNLKVFAERLVDKHGKGILEYLEKESKKNVKLTVEKVRKLRTYFEGEVLRLRQKLNL